MSRLVLNSVFSYIFYHSERSRGIFRCFSLRLLVQDNFGRFLPWCKQVAWLGLQHHGGTTSVSSLIFGTRQRASLHYYNFAGSSSSSITRFNNRPARPPSRLR